MAVRTFAFAALVLAACPDRPVAAVPPRPQPEVSRTVDISTKRELDILFVIDNSGSMGDEQKNLINNFPQFMKVLETVEGGLPDVHIGVVSSDMGAGSTSFCAGNDRGILQNQALGEDCSAPAGRFIVDEALPDGSRQKNYSGSLESTFGCIAQLGTSGCGFEQHLDAMRAALDGRNPENAGFLREDALLAVVFIADEDDCSVENLAISSDVDDSEASEIGAQPFRCTQWGVTCDGAYLPRAEGTYSDCVPREKSPYLYEPAQYVDFLLSKKPREKLLLAGIIGPQQPFAVVRREVRAERGPELQLDYSCHSAESTQDRPSGAVPAIRIQAVLDAFDLSVSAEICDESLSPALEEIAEAIKGKLTPTCLPGSVDLTDVYEDRPGVQPNCSITQIFEDEETVIGRCNVMESGEVAPGNDLPCWYLREESPTADGLGECTTTGSTHLIEIERSGPPPETADLRMSCVATVPAAVDP